MKLFTAASFLVSLSGAVEYTPDQLVNEITSLPEVPAGVDFKMFSGYIPVNKETEAERSLFYWFVESQGNPDEDPVLLWTNGGPGCSGLSGFMTELGPFRMTGNQTLKMNPSAWNKHANIVFIEQPAGVGFSPNEASGFQYGDKQAAVDNANFIVKFFSQYSQFKSHEFYTTSESYGGHYLPTLAKELVTNGDVPNFKGFMVGNPLTYMPYRNYGQYGTYAGHNLLPKPLWDKFVANSCHELDASESICGPIINTMDELTSKLNPYALDFPTCQTNAGRTGRFERAMFMAKINEANNKPTKLGAAAAGLKGYYPADYEPCDSNWASEYLNREDVQTAIHVRSPGSVTWGECSNAVGGAYSQTDVNEPMMPVYQFLVNQTKQPLDIMIYSGDDDAICATLGTQQFVWDLGFAVKEDWSVWSQGDGQVAGYTTLFDGLRFTTVHGAGHMVPSTRPSQSLDLLRKFLQKDW